MQIATAETAYNQPIETSQLPRKRLARARRFAPKPVLSVGVASLIVYLFVVHSYKINLGSAAIAAGLFGMLLQRPIRSYAPIYFFAGFLAWCAVTLPASVNFDVSWNAWVDSAKIFAIAFLAFNVIKTPQQVRLVTLAWLGMFAFYPVRGTLVNFINGNGDFGRYGWNYQFANFNDMAALTLIPLGLAMERLRSPDKKWVKLCALMGVVALPFIVLITQSRGGMLGLSAMLLYLLARSRYRKKIAMATAAVGVVAILFAPQGVWERIQKMTYLTSVETLGQSDSSAEQRYVIWQVAERIIADNPVLGVGIGAYPIAHEQYVRLKPEWATAHGPRDTHSTYLHVLAENGVLGVALFLGIFVMAYLDFVGKMRSLKGRTDPPSKLLRDRCQIYISVLVGLTVCAIFGSLESMVFPFLFISLGAAGIRLTLPVVPDRQQALS